MSQVMTWPATSTGHYVIDVVIGGIAVKAMIDSGLVDPAQLVGFELAPGHFDRLHQAGLLKDVSTRTRRDAGGGKSLMRVGMASTSLTLPNTSTPVGPSVDVFVARSPAGLPTRVGLAFFHKLNGCQVHWDCSARTWSMLMR